MPRWPRRVCRQCVVAIKGIRELSEKIAASQDQLLRMIPSSSGKDLDPLPIDPYIIHSTPALLRPKLEAGLSGSAFLEQSPIVSGASPTARLRKQCPTKEIEPDLAAELERRNLLKCLLCKIQTPSHADLMEHSLRVHCRTGTIYCCQELFYCDDILAHMKYHLDEDAFKCPKCGLKLNAASKLYSHLRKHCFKPIVSYDETQIDSSTLECVKCKMKFATVGTLRRHLKFTCGRLYARVGKLSPATPAFTVKNAKDPAARKQNGPITCETLKEELRKRNLLTCPYCKTEEVSWDSLLVHMRKKHDGRFYVFCCKVKFSCVDILDHMRFHLDEEAFECTECEELFLCSRALRVHVEKGCPSVTNHELLPMDDNMEVEEEEESQSSLEDEETNEGPIVYIRDASYETIESELRKRQLLICTVCNVEQETRHSLIAHMRDKHEGTWHITCCDEKFDAVEIMDHMRIHLMEPPSEEEKDDEIPTITDADLETELRERNLLVCHICSEETESFEQLMDHMQEAHNTLGYIFCCNIKFQRDTALEHVKFHIDEDLFKCEVCGAFCITQPELKAHKKRHHSDKERTLYPCETCGKTLVSPYSLENHKRTHLAHREFTFVCEVCGKGFDIQSQFTAHSYTHKQRKTEQCMFCGKHVFSLQPHISSVHSNKKKETCDVCGVETFKLKIHLRRVHSVRSSDFKCHVCGKSFDLANSLKRHMENHTGKRVKCQFCDHTASNRTNSGTHMKLKHPEEYEEYKARNNRCAEARLEGK